jgi:hypothetical protein
VLILCSNIHDKMKNLRRARSSGFILPAMGCLIAFFVLTSLTIHTMLDKSVDRARRRNIVKTVMKGRQPPKKVPYRPSSYRHRYEHEQQLSPLEVHSRVEKLRQVQTVRLVSGNHLEYDIHRCPPEIPHNYPIAWNIVDVLTNWNPDDTTVPPTIHQGLCSIDWNDPEQQKIAVRYRRNEMPFLIHNHPEIWQATERWSHFDYLHSLVGGKPMRNEHSNDNHMMFWKLRGRNARFTENGWTPPTEDVDISFKEWHEKAMALENPSVDVAHTEHYYFRLNGIFGGTNDYLYDELPFFNPRHRSEVFMVDPEDARGINCRFGSRGIIAESHYDESRNFILMLRGQKRYILAHPNQCRNLELYKLGHPSARHSRINWSDAESWRNDGENFSKAQVNEVVLQAGDGLYLPTYWFHFIVSLNLNYQCNARSGTTDENHQIISSCGF